MEKKDRKVVASTLAERGRAGVNKRVLLGDRQAGMKQSLTKMSCWVNDFGCGTRGARRRLKKNMKLPELISLSGLVRTFPKLDERLENEFVASNSIWNIAQIIPL